MKNVFELVGASIARLWLPLEGKLSPKVTDEVENTSNKKHLIRQAGLTPSSRGEGSGRGFTIVEVVIALTVIVLVTGVSIGVVMVDNKAHVETIDMIEATNIAENAVECFRFAVRNGGDFEDLMKTANITLENATFEGYTSGYKYTNGRVTVEIKFSDSDNTEPIEFDTITVSAYSTSDENLLEPKTYTVR